MATFTYNITSPGPADGSPSPQLNTVHLLEAYTPDPWSDEKPQHLHPMPMPMLVPLFSASGDLSKDAASEVFADFSDPRLGEERHIQADRSEQVIPLVSDRWEGDAWGETLHNQECIILPLSQVKILKLVYKRDGDEMYQIVGRIDVQETRGYGTQGKPWKCLGSAEDPIIIDGPMSPNLLSDSDPFVAIPSLQRNIERVPGGYKVDVERESWQKLSTAETAGDCWFRETAGLRRLLAWGDCWRKSAGLGGSDAKFWCTQCDRNVLGQKEACNKISSATEMS
ncbi:predicted protein [Histoplasma mississippiense (nom. inval.)]|uniref:predicted protein n=1 Tax=Ajellomyces capsulatus (strain NAm1 / WU24) TaxID=2059318 RepID=UPI000157B3CE|nr:predicted protein [Histoplasma mississippiense (nom. inval.)]EDN02510.1 predicted protein [Histoplasma mississippiense (nom. inval.)]